MPPTETTDVYELLLEANLDCDDSVAESGGEESSIDIYSNDDADDNEATTDDNEFPTNDGPTEELREDPWRFVDTPSTIDLPDEIQDNMFVPPDDFSSDWFAKAVKAGGDGIGFGYAAGQNQTNRLKSQIDLLQILKGHDLNLFDKIMQWKLRCEVDYNDIFRPAEGRPKTRKTVLKELSALYGYDKLEPTVKKITLPHTEVTVNMIVFPFRQMLLSMLTNPISMQPENLSFDKCNPTKKPVEDGDDGYYDDLGTGSISVTAHETYCKDNGKDMLCELMLFIDKTHLDVKGKHTLEPIMFTLGIFNRHYRNKSEAWRPLGYLPNLDQLAPHSSADEKQQDYQYCVRIMMSELVACQQLGGIDWTFAFDDEDVHVRLQIPVNSLMGDTEGHDKAMCRKVDRQGKDTKSQLCRQCDVKFCELGDPDPTGEQRAKWNLTTCGEIRRMRNNLSPNDKKVLNKMGYKFFHDGMVDVHFSDPVYGLHGCTFAEVLHAFQLGLANKTIETCFGTKRSRATARASGNDSTTQAAAADIEAAYSSDEDSQENGPVPFNPDDIETTRSYVFNAAARRRVDELAKELHRHLRWQSDVDLPRTTFPSGITKLAKLQGHERTGVLLILLIILTMEHWANWRRGRKENTLKPNEDGYLENVLTKSRCDAMIKSLYLLISYEAYMRTERIPKESLDEVDNFIPAFLDQVIRAFDRKYVTSVGNNTIKGHYPNHLCLNISRGGSPQNTNSGVGEHLHLTSAKEPGRRTNMNRSTFELQTGRRYNETLAVDRSYVDHPLSWLQSTEEDCSDVDYSGALCLIAEDHYINYVGKKVFGSPRWENSPVSGEDVSTFIRTKVLPKVKRDRIAIKTKTARQGITFTANPCYGKDRAARQHWALVKQDKGKPVPYHLLCFLELEEAPASAIKLNGTTATRKGHYALAHSVLDPLTDSGGPPDPNMYKETNSSHTWGSLAHPDQHLLHRSPKAHYNGETWEASSQRCPPTLQIIPCDAIHSPIVGFPDILKHKNDRATTDYFFIVPPRKWGQLFIEAAHAEAMCHLPESALTETTKNKRKR